MFAIVTNIYSDVRRICLGMDINDPKKEVFSVRYNLSFKITNIFSQKYIITEPIRKSENFSDKNLSQKRFDELNGKSEEQKVSRRILLLNKFIARSAK